MSENLRSYSEKAERYAESNRRIAKNTMMLYIRMFVMMIVSLYTSRIVLSALGVDDFGIHNVVGGVVTMFTIISSSLSSAIGRFITFELGRGDQQRLNRVFSTAVIIQLLLAILIIFATESIGMWFLTHKMVIPPDRLYAAKWVLQLSLLTLLINLISIPYNAAMIAHEKISAFAYISLINTFGQLAVAYTISISVGDRLIIYAALLSAVALIVRVIYGLYCQRNFEECRRFRWHLDRALFKEMFNFAGWNFIGSTASLLRDQGGNILLNLFGGPVVNAARGVSTQVAAAVTSFSSNFMIALNPQITKSYASDEREYMHTLLFQGARLSLYMLLLISLPILINTEYILSLWLKEVPEYSVIFVQLTLILGMIESISNPLITAMLATGRIRNYQIVVGGIYMLNFPISYLLLKIGMQPEIVLIVAIAIAMCTLFSRLYMLRGMIGLELGVFTRRVIINVSVVAAISTPLPLFTNIYMYNDVLSFIVASLASVISTLAAILYIGCNRTERAMVYGKIAQKLKRR